MCNMYQRIQLGNATTDLASHYSQQWHGAVTEKGVWTSFFMMQLQNVRLSAECFPHYIINGSNTEMISLLFLSHN